ncbi:MAG: ribonuclease P protein component [Verrucomicrobiota bacterium]
MKLPRSRRLTKRSDFQQVRTRGKSIRGRYLVLGYLEEPSLPEPFQLGLITTRKLGNAVVRNRVRRRLRGIAQRIGTGFEPGHKLVLIARHAASEATSVQLEKEWKWLMHQASLMRPKEEES